MQVRVPQGRWDEGWGAPYRATIRVKGVPKYVVRKHVNPATGAFGGAPYRATNRVRGVPN